MKKILFAAVALIAFAACTNDYVVNKDKGSAIAFDKAFVENSTRAADYTANNIADFGVYGFITNNSGEGKIFNNQLVTKSGDAYVYSPAQYWVGGATYSFSALVPYTGRQWAYAATDSENGVISFDNAAAAANQDLLFAYAQKTTPASITAAPEAVAFTFNHLLSRVKFSFTNGFGEGQNIELKVSNVHVTDAYAEGTIALVDGVLEQAWTPANNTLDVAFGDAGAAKLGVNAKGTTEHFYLIPAVEATYNVTFDVEIIQAGVLVDTYNRTATVTLGMERGKSYDLQALLTYQNTSDDGTLYPIEFTVNKVEDWAEFGEAEVTVPQHEVATAAEFAAAVAEGGNIVLTQDINLDAIASTLATRADAGYGLQITKDCVIDGAGHTLTSTKIRAMAVCNGATNVIFKNFSLNAGGERGIQIEGNAKNVVIENVTAVAKNYTVNLPSSASNANVTIKDCSLKGLNVINVWGENAVVNIENTVLRCEDNAAEAYALVYNGGVNAIVNVKGGEVVITGTNTEGTYAGALDADGAEVNFDGTKGDCTVEGHNFAIYYGDYRYTFATFEAAYEKALEGETIVVIRNVTIKSHLNIAKSVNLDLNGKTIFVDTAAADNGAGDDAIWVRDNAEVTISGNGTIEFVSVGETYGSGIFATGNSKVTIESVNVIAGAEAVFAQAAAQVVINGGTYKSIDHPEFTLNLRDKNTKPTDTATITVYGGSYYKYDPRNSSSESPMANFVAEGKTVEQEGDWYIVK